MRSLPERLLQADFVRVYYRAGATVLLQKTLDRDLTGQQSYLATHACSVVLEGRQRIETVDGTIREVAAGQALLLQRGLYTIHDAIAENGRFRALLLFFDEATLRNELPLLSPTTPASGPSPWTFSAPTYALPFLHSLDALTTQFSTGAASLWSLKVREWMAVLLRDQPAPFAALARQATGPHRSLRAFMQDHFDKPLTIADYAYLTGRSESTFRREFKQRFGTTPRKWITRMRLEKARELLRDIHEDVHSIALAIGYESSSHFILEFKKQFGTTPKQFQQSGRPSPGKN